MNLRQCILIDIIRKKIKNIEKELEEIYELAEEIPEKEEEQNNF